MRIVLTALLTLSLLLGFARAAGTDPLEDGIAAYQRGDYATALRLLRPLAQQGNARAQNRLGLMYDNGRGVGENNAEAMKWYLLAANQGNVSAQYNLGQMYSTGESAPQGYAEAVLEALFSLGPSVSRDYVEAHKWFSLAAAAGDKDAAQARSLIEQSMTQEQIAEARRRAAEWRPSR